MTAHCEDCRFWTRYNHSGTCQRHAPIIKEPQSHPERGIWPWTSAGDWCGDFEPIKPPAPLFRILDKASGAVVHDWTELTAERNPVAMLDYGQRAEWRFP